MSPIVKSEDEYEDLLGQWSDLESGLGIMLGYPASAQEFEARLYQYDRWMQDLIQRDTDVALYLLFQLAAQSPVGYSTSHALVCAVLCHLVAQEFELTPHERNSLVRAALTMNIAMTALQDVLAEQRERPSTAQQEAIRNHPHESQALLTRLFIKDSLWLDVVGQHHAALPERVPLAQQPAKDRLTRILGTIDRYAAMISPRKSRAGRSATDSVRAIVGQEDALRDEVSYTLVRAVGLCPPGTFVRLDNGDIAVVLRRSEKANHPLVASIIDARGEPRHEPRLHQTAVSKPRVQSALARSAVTVELNHRTMVRVGLYAAQRSTSLVSQPGGL